MESSNPPPFLLDTSGHCLLCLKKPNDTLKTFSFQNICSYLKTDLKEVFSDTMSFSSPSELERSELKGPLCGGCAQHVRNFSLYFAELEAIQRKLKTCLKSIHGSMMEIGVEDETSRVQKLGEFKKEMLRKPYTSFQFGIVERLRRTTIENCSKLLEASEEELEPAQLIVKEEVIMDDQDEIPLDISETKYCPPPWKPKPKETFLHKCNMCPKTFPTYRARLAHQRSCPKKLFRQPLNPPKKPSVQRIFPEETFILPDAISGAEKPENCFEVIAGGKSDETTSVSGPYTSSQTDSGEKIVRPLCHTCSKSFKDFHGLKRHYKRVHMGRKRCEICGKEFSQVYFPIHQQSVHMGAKSKCEICHKQFSKKANLQAHKYAAHFGKLYRCKYCFKTFKYISAKGPHMKRCTGRNAASFTTTTSPQ